ncbi:MAG: response regulator, partial [bacterium]
MEKRRILWIDDEIELLRPHILFLEERGYDITGVTNGEDAISKIQAIDYDVILLDKHLIGRDGFDTFTAIKALRPHVATVMITKNEE